MTRMLKLSQMKSSTRGSLTAAKRPMNTRLLIDVQNLRESRGVTLRAVKKAIGISDAALCAIEHGCTPRLDTAFKLAAFLEIPVERIWALKGKG